ncbi:hypothetical protein FE391_33115 [Nonomuraea sp. KC401]|uniref:hypothetical protein n=1 Tax=unclassified Nonomuraea TaxID=2593643 RepID=UPI0010FD88BF|nr:MULTISPECIES: hypothetical protein [unclassified Nonomuraea]NBE98541.1 hypothetical protein [Nonomuraea sp. K271]TLF60897.1 hypothetical protein FE391_33115 [Nonomuraea sp. KC401]
MTNSFSGELADLTLPVERGCPFAPPTAYEWLREQAPISKVHLASGGEAWLVSGYEQCRAVLADPARFWSYPARRLVSRCGTRVFGIGF